jgi:hypothetical protein
MCDACPPPPPSNHPATPSGPSSSKGSPLLSRRAFLALTGVAGGIVAGLYTSCQPPQGTVSTRLAPLPPATTRTPLATASQPVAATAAASQPLAATSPAPNLGAEIFPDALGRPMARAADAPVIIIPRSQWTSAPPNFANINLMNGIDKLTVHHTAGAMNSDAWKPTANALEGIRGFHAGSAATDRHWADIAYHFAVDRAGRVWQARPLVYQGAHARGHNEHNLGIVLLGDFETQSPSAAQLWSLGAFISFVRTLYQIPLPGIYTHGELGQTSCPGKKLQSFMNRTRQRWASAEGTAWQPRTT